MLINCPYLHDLDSDSIDQLYQLSSSKIVSQNQTIFRQKECVDYVYLVLYGSIDLYLFKSVESNNINSYKASLRDLFQKENSTLTSGLRKLARADKNKFSSHEFIVHKVDVGEMIGHENLKISSNYAYNARCSTMNGKLLVVKLKDL